MVRQARPNQLFQMTGSNHPGRSRFNLSYSKTMTMDMGQIIPIVCEEALPGDTWRMGNKIVLRFQPLVAPILHEVNVFTYYFFIPNRIIWDEWEDFITGGVQGTLEPTLPTFNPYPSAEANAIGSLWDYFGLPTGVQPEGAYPLDFPWRAYNKVWNEFFRDQTLQAELDIVPNGAAESGTTVLNCCWEKDYFTSALPWQQRGTAPALPISGTTSAVFAADVALRWPPINSVGMNVDLRVDDADFAPYNDVTKSGLERGKALKTGLDANTVDLSNATTFDVADLRLAFACQRWLELNARAGARYTEFLQAHYAVSPRDDRLQRPEYIGATRAPVIISEVLQTGSTDATSPQGNMAGHGISVDSSFAGSYHVQEHGIILGVMVVKPRAMYQQGIDRQWLHRTKYDYYSPEFAYLSEQQITRAEIYANDVEADNLTAFGYQGHWDELRYKRSMVCGQMRSAFAYWHMGRIFDTAPTLNSEFVTMKPRKDIFAVPSEPGLIASVGNILDVVRPLPVMSQPGLIDHVY